jgi:hypothetical protein
MARRPFFGQGPAPQIARMNMQAATAPGRAYAAAFQKLGDIASDTLEKFREKKEEKEREDNFERMANKLPSEVFSAFGVQSEEEKSDFIKKIKKKGPREDAMAIMSFYQKAQDAKDARDVRNLQMDQLRRNIERQKDADLLAEQARQKQEAQAQIYDQFLSGREMVDMQLGRTDTNPLMRNVPGPTTQVPQGEYKGNRFFQTEQGKSDFTSLVDAGIDASDALEMAGKREADLLESQPKAPDMFKLSDEIRKATEFQQGQDAITFTPERNTIVLGDTVYGISGKFGNEAEVIKLKSVEIPNYSNMNSVMNQLISLGEKRKTTKFMSNADKTLAQSLSNQLRGLLREQILGPGTVTDPERAILNEIVQNPTTWMDTAGNTQSKIDSLKGIRKDAFNKLKTRLTGLGLNVAEIGQGDESSSSKSSVNFDQETPSGLGYTEINLDQL